MVQATATSTWMSVHQTRANTALRVMKACPDGLASVQKGGQVQVALLQYLKFAHPAKMIVQFMPRAPTLDLVHTLASASTDGRATAIPRAQTSTSARPTRVITVVHALNPAAP
jgi:hypothetical protein